MLNLFTLSVCFIWIMGCTGCQTIKEKIKDTDLCETDNCSTRTDPILSPDPIPEIDTVEICDSPDCIDHQKPSEPEPQDQTLTELQKEFLDAHNDWRKSVGIHPLKYSSELEKIATDWSKILIDDYFCKMMHNPRRGQGVGENIYWHSNYKMSNPTKAVDAWGEEVGDYNYETNKCADGKVCGHYTQIVWADTERVGCSLRRCDAGTQVVVVCNYEPAGNWVGKKPY